jgi:hypothetical protein
MQSKIDMYWNFYSTLMQGPFSEEEKKYIRGRYVNVPMDLIRGNIRQAHCSAFRQIHNTRIGIGKMALFNNIPKLRTGTQCCVTDPTLIRSQYLIQLPFSLCLYKYV